MWDCGKSRTFAAELKTVRKKKMKLLAASLLAVASMNANAEAMDSVRNVELEEISVVSGIKENGLMRQQPASSMVISSATMEANQGKSLKALSHLVPNLFIPDYGSHLTSAFYIRGIGSRINTPAVGLYVDDLPYFDKSAFDFNLSDVERVDVLRGPQGTLYGRNTLGGIVRVYTKNPFHYEGTDVSLGYATGDNHRNASVSHFHRISDRFAFVAGGYYEGNDGFFKNDLTGKKVDDGQTVGGRLRGIYKATDRLTFDLSANYDYCDEGAYPYYYTGTLTEKELYPDLVGKISNNHENTYRRNLFNAGLKISYDWDNVVINSVTSYQNLSDRMFLDQDFISADIYTLEQRQRINTLTEELTARSKHGRIWNWVSGANITKQWLRTTGPVSFCSDGIAWLEGNINSSMPANPPMSINFRVEELRMGGTFDTPMLNLGIYHQSTFNITKALSVTAGFRFDYEKNSMDYDAPAQIDYGFRMPMMKVDFQDLTANITEYEGTMDNDHFEVLPKVAVKYDFDAGSNVYLSVSRGMRSGGYNVQMFSDILQGAMQKKMMDGVKDAVFAYLDKNMPMMADKLKPIISAAMPQMEMPEVDVVSYNPEFSWNYEIGTHLTLADRTLMLDGALFYNRINDQQIARFAPSGLGRMMVNAGKSKSYGGEVTVMWSPCRSLVLRGNYGYTQATFVDYITAFDADSEKGEDYSGNYVPFVPKHTMNLDAAYTWYMGDNALTFGANCSGAGRIYWTESNSASESFYSLLGARLSYQTPKFTVTLWGKNILDKDYSTFYFESASRGYEQCAKPARVGVDLMLHL